MFPALICIAMVADVLFMRIWNWLTAFVVLAYLVLAPIYGVTIEEMATHILAAVCALAVCVPLFAFNLIGGGDAKLIVGNVLWIGAGQALIEYVLLAAFFGGVLAVFTVFARYQLQFLPMRCHLPQWLSENTSGVPYGVALGSAALIVYPDIVFL